MDSLQNEAINMPISKLYGFNKKKHIFFILLLTISRANKPIKKELDFIFGLKFLKNIN